MRFQDPEPVSGGGDDRLLPRDIVNHLLLIWPIEYVDHSPTKYTRPGQKSDLVVVDVVDLDLPDDRGIPGKLSRSCWWRNSRLIQALKGRVGSPDPLLAFMTQGTAEPGMSAPYVLVGASTAPSCVAQAEAWERANPGFTPSQPSFGQQQYQQPVAVPYNQAPQRQPAPHLPPAAPPPQTQMGILERMAASAQQGASRLPQQREEPPF